MRSSDVLTWASLLLAVGVGSVLYLGSPMLAIALAILLWIAILAARSPWQLACGLAFLTSAFPKAGFKVGDFPIPVFLAGLLVVALVVARPSNVERVPLPRSAIMALLVFIAWMTWRAAALLDSAGLADTSALLAWTIGPAVLIVLVSRVRPVDPMFLRSFERGFLLAAGFGLVQFVFGIEETKISGLTIAYGDSYAAKNNVIFSGEGADFSKIMSTYQGGNTFGVAAAVFFLLGAQRLVRGRATRHDLVLAAAAAIAIGLSGSRTAILAAVVGSAVLYVLSGSVAKKLAILGLTVLAGFVTLALVPGLAERYSISQLAETGGAGRTDSWRRGFEATSTLDLFTGAPAYLPLEGLPGMILQIGFVGILLYGLVALPIIRTRTGWLVPIMGLLAGCAVDYTYALFPTLFVPAVMVASSAISRRTADSPDHVVERPVVASGSAIRAAR